MNSTISIHIAVCTLFNPFHQTRTLRESRKCSWHYNVGNIVKNGITICLIIMFSVFLLWFCGSLKNCWYFEFIWLRIYLSTYYVLRIQDLIFTTMNFVKVQYDIETYHDLFLLAVKTVLIRSPFQSEMCGDRKTGLTFTSKFHLQLCRLLHA